MARLPAHGRRGSEDGRGARRPAARLPGQRGLRAAARDRRHARPPRRHAPPPARVGDDGGERGARRPGAAARVRRRHDGESRCSRSATLGAGRVARVRRRCRSPRPILGAVGRRAVDRVRAQPPGATAPRGAVGRPTARFSATVARKTWRYFDTFVGAEDHACRPTTSRSRPTLTIAHRTSPTNIGLGLLATLAAHDLGFIDTRRAGRADRRDAHDHRTARTLRRPPAQLVRHADAGAAAAGLRLDGRQRQPGRRAR